MDYTFTANRQGQTHIKRIANFMVLPNGTTDRNMDAVHQIAKSRQYRHYGALQVQIIVNRQITPERMDEIVVSIGDLITPVLDAIPVKAQGEKL